MAAPHNVQPRKRIPETADGLLAALEPLVDQALNYRAAILKENQDAMRQVVAKGRAQDSVPDTLLTRLFPSDEEKGPFWRMSEYYANHLISLREIINSHKTGARSASEALQAIVASGDRHPADKALASLKEMLHTVQHASPEQIEVKEAVREVTEKGLQDSIANFGPLQEALGAIAAHVNKPRVAKKIQAGRQGQER